MNFDSLLDIQNKPKVFFLVGPTATGKTALSVQLAQKMSGEIVSADSMQIYQGMDIGTAKPTPDEMSGVVHHGFDLVNPQDTFSVFDYRNFALKAIAEIISRDHVPFVVGGTGLYVRALLDGLSEELPDDPDLRDSLNQKFETDGLSGLVTELGSCDKSALDEVDLKNPRRVMRAIEIVKLSGKPLREQREKRESLEDLGFQPIVIGIDRDREPLYERIDHRVDQMVEMGLEDEVRRLLEAGFSQTAKKAVGYGEIIDWIASGESEGFDEVINLIKQHSRNLAKRQWTWFKKERNIHWAYWPEDADVALMTQYVYSHLKRAV